MSRTTALLSVILATSAAVRGQPVSFRDPGLKAAIEARLHITNPQPADMLKLMYLIAPEKGISDLTGLQHAVNLATLNLSTNSISDLSPLKGLANLTRAYLSENAITDPSALAGCTKLQYLDFGSNQLTDITLWARP